MKASLRPTPDPYVEQLVKQICATISARFPEATFEIGAHPTQRGALIDAHVPTDDDFAVFHHVFDIAFVQRVRPQTLIDVVDDLDVLEGRLVEKIGDANQ